MTKQEIIERIEELFYEKSFAEVSMQDIATKIGMKKASLYYHFPSKEQLIGEVLDYSFGVYLIFINEIIKNWNENNFLELLQEFLDFGDKNKNIFSIINQNGYEENDDITNHNKEKQKIIFDTIHKAMETKNGFSKEKTFLFLTIINQIGRKKSIYNLCEIDKNKILGEIEKLFFN
ncbi:MAG: TetR/AcrR family transcriptional regulator [Candidatus Gracilibacteria bacterium]|nr:TetR/AcrR family transcriptional regulator [Candidatus Gracilibacteria bacterium]